MTATSLGLSDSTINIADAGQSPQDGFAEYQGYPGLTRPRWGDYSWGISSPTAATGCTSPTSTSSPPTAPERSSR